jgi:hypothetical protein
VGSFARYAVSVSAIVTLLAGCAGASDVTAPLAEGASRAAAPHQRTFYYVDKLQRFKVPAGVSSITVVARGAAGGAAASQARGGRVFAVVPVRPKETLYVYVGGAGIGSIGGFNGGASGGNEGVHCSGYGGGGATDIREGGRALADRIIVSGGAGGSGGNCYLGGGAGGKGGGKTGGAGAVGGDGSQYYGGGGGGGGTQSAGGNGGGSGTGSLGYGDPGADGSLAVGGAGGAGQYGGGGGGGGGGGYYGGGGGGAGGVGTSDELGGGGGGGGGSSYVEPSATRSRMWQGWWRASSNGLVVISW